MSAGFFYLSMVDESRPRGERFVGATIVDAADAVGALEAARKLRLIPPGVQVAMVELYTQDAANLRITTLDMLPLDAKGLLWLRRASAAEIKAGGSKPLTGNDVSAWVCKDHASLL